MVLIKLTLAFTNCVRSLSPVETTQRMPASAACRASVPMTSSASTPSIINSGQPRAATAWCSGSIWRTRSGGMGGRCALYSAYHSSRKVLPLASNTQAR